MERSLAWDQDHRHNVPSSSQTKRCHAVPRGIAQLKSYDSKQSCREETKKNEGAEEGAEEGEWRRGKKGKGAQRRAPGEEMKKGKSCTVKPELGVLGLTWNYTCCPPAERFIQPAAERSALCVQPWSKSECRSLLPVTTAKYSGTGMHKGASTYA
ncbi:hypothetical protein L3Q82_012278, partial [Scortum barcoo]